MVYNFLPFMVLPLYNVLVKIDKNVINAARDLGANGIQTFVKIIFPLSLPGMFSGITMVFVPALTTFVISKMLGGSKNYKLLEVELITGRHHQIRCQLSKVGCPIKGDLKYGAKRSNQGGGISLHSRSVEFLHPVRKEPVRITAPVPVGDSLWQFFEESQE